METEILERLIEDYKLSSKEHKTVLQMIKSNLFFNKCSKKASAMLVIGQPGCGKTIFIQNADLSDYIIINSDDYRHLNRFSDEIINKYPTYYAKLTNFDAHLWGDELFAYAVDEGYSVLREKAPIDYSLLEIFERISCKCDIVINVLVTGNLSSLLATRERYEKEIC